MHAYYITGFFFLKHENVHSQKIYFCEPKPFLVGNSAQLQADFLSLAGFSPESNRALAVFPYFTACIHKDLIFFLLPFCNFLFIMFP